MRDTFKTLNQRLDMKSPPMLLWQKAKKYGTWNPSHIDFSKDAQDYQQLSDNEKKFFLQLLAQFQAGEEAVTLDLLPLIMAVAKEGRLEEEMFLTSFLWEEAKHVEGFNRILTYNMIIEGVLAETGYYSFYKVLDEHQIMPGIREFIGKLKQDESRHIAYGIFLISRLVAENGDEVWEAVESQMNKVMQPAMGQIAEGYAIFGDNIPFGMDLNEMSAYAMDQFQKRWARIERARSQSIEEIYKVAEAVA